MRSKIAAALTLVAVTGGILFGSATSALADDADPATTNTGTTTASSSDITTTPTTGASRYQSLSFEHGSW